MIFPLWYPGTINTGLFIGLISVIHVFVAYFAVGGGFFLLACERMAVKERSAALFDWTEKHSTFFLLVTMVFGALTGVALWLVLTLVSPAGSAFLLREFIFFWLAEWVFFLAEIIALLLYVYHFSSVRQGKMTPNQHMIFAAFYAFFAFLSLVTINGIVSFMLTPGAWVHTKNIWDAFFNPSYWPALVFRFSLALLLAGLFGLVTATTIKNSPLRYIAVRKCAHWIVLPSIALMVSTYWYNSCLPLEIQTSIAERTSYMRPFVRSFLDTLPLIFFGGILLLIRMPRLVSQPLTILLLLCGLVITGSFEWVRESARRPWLVYNYMYSNGLTPEQGQTLTEQGLLTTAPWAHLIIQSMAAHTNNHTLTDSYPAITMHNSKEKSIITQNTPAQKNSTKNIVTHNTPLETSSEALHFAPLQFENLPKNAQEHYGKLVFTAQCAPCHGVNTSRLDIVPLLQNRGSQGINALLQAQGHVTPYMPPFFGTEQDRKALVTWLSTFTPLPEETSPLVVAPFIPESSPFDMETSKYVLTSFTTQGMLHSEGSHSLFRFSTNATDHTFGNTIVAQLILRDTTPQVITDGIQITYTFLDPDLLFNDENILTEKQNNSTSHEDKKTTIASVSSASASATSSATSSAASTAASTASTASASASPYASGSLTQKDDSTSFESQPIPIYPHSTRNSYNPYPIAKIEAKNSEGVLLATTHVVVPVSSELGCKNCHGGGWANAAAGGIEQSTSIAILQTHDKRNKTQLTKNIEDKNTQCSSCHNGQNNMHLSTAIHGFHAFMGLQGSSACASCHPANHEGKTYMQRDIHALWGLTCTSCHGTLEEHSMALLQYDAQKHTSAQKRLDQLVKKNAEKDTNKLTKEAEDTAENRENTSVPKKIMPRKAWVQQPDCTTCHDFSKKPDSATANAFNTWTTGDNELFAKRYENTNTIRCGSCHSSPHATWPAENPLGHDLDNMVTMQYQDFPEPLGANNNCQVCHTVPMEYSIHHDIVTP